MRKRVCLAAILILASVAILVTVSCYVEKPRDSVAFFTVSESGDRAAADGLTLDVTSRCWPLRWESHLQFVGGSLSAETQSAYDDSNRYRITYSTDIPAPTLDTFYQDSLTVIEPSPLYELVKSWYQDSSAGSTPIRLQDCCPYYPLFLTSGYDLTTFDLTELIQIEVPEDHTVSITSMYDETYFEIESSHNQMPAVDVVYQYDDSGIYFSVAFAAGAAPQQSWAPQGFGVWFLPIETTPLQLNDGVKVEYLWEDLQLLLPLDITAQRVMALDRSEDGKLLLTTCEDGMYHLRVLDEQNRVQQTLPVLAETEVNRDRENASPDNCRFFGFSNFNMIDTELYMGDGFMVLYCCDGRFSVLDKENGLYRVAMVQDAEEEEDTGYQYVASPRNGEIHMTWNGERLATVSAFIVAGRLPFHLRVYQDTGEKLYDAQWSSSLSQGTYDVYLEETPAIAWAK